MLDRGGALFVSATAQHVREGLRDFEGHLGVQMRHPVAKNVFGIYDFKHHSIHGIHRCGDSAKL